MNKYKYTVEVESKEDIFHTKVWIDFAIGKDYKVIASSIEEIEDKQEVLDNDTTGG